MTRTSAPINAATRHVVSRFALSSNSDRDSAAPDVTPAADPPPDAARRPVWLLDVDGVLNADRPAWEPLRTGRIVHEGVSWRFRWSPTLIARIRWLVVRHQIELRLCSAWCDAPGPVQALFRLHAPPIRTGDPMTPDDKLDAADGVLAAGRRLIWTDDSDIPRRYGCGLPPGTACVIQPQERVGLTPDHIAVIDRWCFAYRS